MPTSSAAILLSLCLLLPAPDAFAQTARAAGAPDPTLGKKEDSGGPGKDLAGDVSRPKVGKKDGGPRPTLEYDKFRFTVELQLKDKRRELLRTLQQMSELNNDPKEKPDLLFRLGELYWEESKYWFFEMNRKDDELIACKEKKDEACLAAATAEKQGFAQKKDQFQAEAIEKYKSIFKQYPQYKRLDEVLFFLAQNLYEKGDVRDAMKAYEQLIKRFPQSKYVPDSYLAFGEFYFNNSKGRRELLQKALEAYERAAQFTESKVYGFAIYKQGWCHYNLGDFPAAADKYKATIYYGDLAGGTAKDNKAALVREARKDYVLSYSHFGDPTAAKDDFKKVGGDENWWGMLNGLAGIYYDDGKDKESILVYRALIKDRPTSPQAPFFQGRIVDAVMRVGKKQITVVQARELVKIFQAVEKSGNIKTEQDKASLKEAKELAERTLSNLAVSWHNEGKKTRDEETFLFANEAYNDYLAIFPDTAKSYDLRFFHAELLFENLQKYDLAAEEYSKVVRMDVERVKKSEKPGKWLTKSTEGALFSYDEVVKKTDDPTEKEAAKNPTRQFPIPPLKQALLEACENYLTFVPGGDKRVEIAYKAAQIKYRYNYFDEAVKSFAIIALENPGSELAVYSANLILDVYNLQGDFERIDEWARKFYAEPKLAKGDFKADLERIIEKNTFKLAEKIAAKGEHEQAAERYIAFVKDWPKSELADEAVFNASIELYKAGRVLDSIRARDRIIKEFPDSNLGPQALFANAGAYADIGDYAPAADYFELYVARWVEQKSGKGGKRAPASKKGAKAAPVGPPKKGPTYEEDKAKTALFDAGIFREGLGDYRRALKDREQYVELWPKDADTEDVFLSVALLHERNKKYNDALRQLEAYGQKYTRDPAKVLANELRIVKIYEKQKNKGAAKKTYERIWDYYKKLPGKAKEKLGGESGGGLEAVAQAHYVLSEPYWDEYARIRLKLPEAEMGKLLKLKATKLGEIQKRYTETVGFKVAGPAICGLYKIGMAYQNFAQTFFDAPVPKGLNEEGIENYKAALAEQAQPIELKAIEALETAVGKAREFDVSNECSEDALAKLARSSAEKFPEVIEPVPAPQTPPAPKVGAGLLVKLVAPPVVAAKGSEASSVADVKVAGPKAAVAPKGARAPVDPGSPTAPSDEPPLPKKKKGGSSDEPTDEDLL